MARPHGGRKGLMTVTGGGALRPEAWGRWGAGKNNSYHARQMPLA